MKAFYRNLFPFLLIALAMFTAGGYAHCTAQPSPGYLITSKYGTTYCLHWGENACGIYAWGCTDERIYRCLQDATVRVAP
jgi:hypothetical protein